MLMWGVQVLHSGDLICEGVIKMLAEPAKAGEPNKEAAAAAPVAEVNPHTLLLPPHVFRDAHEGHQQYLIGA
jgi:hypothetical protein